MKVYDLQNEKGNISALILVERGEVERQEGSRDETLTQAVSDAIMSLAASSGLTFLFPRILSCDEQEDGAVMVCFEAAAAPEVKLGPYRGLRVPAGGTPEEFARRAAALAAEQIDAEVPGLIVERELDALLLEQKSAMIPDTRLNLLADIHWILEKGISEVTSDDKKEDLWQQAIETAELYFGTEQPTLSMDQMISAAANVLSLYGKITDSLCARLAQIIEARLDERERLTGEALADQVFEAYLHSAGFSPAQWMEQNRPAALARTRENLTLDAVADAENLTVSEEEIREELARLAGAYQLSAEQVLEFSGKEALRFHLRRGKAKTWIADHAVPV